MAIAGGATTAYRLRMVGGRLDVDRTTMLSDRCTPPARAAVALREWTVDSKPVVVQGSDMATFWQLWGEAH